MGSPAHSTTSLKGPTHFSSLILDWECNVVISKFFCNKLILFPQDIKVIF
jgi:hypothetical protein